jgi:hypothetical protein
MALKALNSIGGFSVGENPSNVILANGDITTGNANLTGNIIANNVLSDNYRYANGAPLDFQQPAGSNYYIQYNQDEQFGASANFTFNPTTSLLSITGNTKTTGTISAGGNITAPFFLGNIIGNITGNIVVPGINTAVLFNNDGNAGASDALTFDYATNVLTIGGNLFSSNANLGNIATANFLGGTLVAASNAQPNITSVGSLTNLSVVGRVTTANLSVTANATVDANFTAGNIRTDGAGTIHQLIAGGIYYPTVDGTANQVLVTDGHGQLGFTDFNTSKISNGNSNVQVLNNANVTISSTGNANIVVVTGTGVNIAGYANISGNANAGNLGVSGIVTVSGNITSANLNTGIVSASGNITGANLTTLGITTTANANVTGFIVSNLIPGTTNNFSLGNSTNLWKDLYLGNSITVNTAVVTGPSGVLTTANANITSNLTTSNLTVTATALLQGDATVSGNLTVNGNTNYINVNNVSIKDPLITLGGTANGGNASAYDGKDRGIVMMNYFSNGAGPINQYFGWKTANSEFLAVANVTSYSGEIVTSSELANIRGNAFIGNLQGTVLQASQTNITELGTLGNLSVTSNITAGGTGNFTTLKGSGLTYPTSDGFAGQIVTTYGNGKLYFSTPSTTSLANGNSNINILANSNITFSSNGVSNVIVVTSNSVVANGNVSVTGNTTSNNIYSNNNIGVGNTNINWATLTTTGTAANQVIVSVPISNIRGAEFFVKGEESTGGKYTISTLSAVHDGASVDYVNYGTVVMGGTTGVLRVNFVSGNIALVVTPSSSNSTVWTTQYKTI